MKTGNSWCPLCGKVVSTKHGMIRHMKIVHQGAEVCKCSECGKDFSTRFALSRHSKRVHEGIVEPLITCTLCNKQFAAKHGLDRHTRLVHQNAEACKCIQCGHEFTTTYSLNRHVRTKHQMLIKPSEQFSSSNLLKGNETTLASTQHSSLINDFASTNAMFNPMFRGNTGLIPMLNSNDLLFPTNQQMPIQQQQANLATSQSQMQLTNLNPIPTNHRTQNSNGSSSNASNSGSISCPMCNKQLAAQKCLERHIKLVHQNAELSVCSLCSRTFSTKYALSRHQKTVHANAVQICSPCGLIFPSRFALIGHNLTAHNTSKVFACGECPQCFPDAESRQTHCMKEHAFDFSGKGTFKIMPSQQQALNTPQSQHLPTQANDPGSTGTSRTVASSRRQRNHLNNLTLQSQMHLHQLALAAANQNTMLFNNPNVTSNSGSLLPLNTPTLANNQGYTANATELNQTSGPSSLDTNSLMSLGQPASLPFMQAQSLFQTAALMGSQQQNSNLLSRRSNYEDAFPNSGGGLSGGNPVDFSTARNEQNANSLPTNAQNSLDTSNTASNK